jgi:DNA ligase (NAD+)
MKSRIETLRSQINHHNHRYYVLGQPEITDRQYDALFEKLLQLEAEYPEYADPNSPTQRLGSDIAGADLQSVPIPHPTPMLSVKSFYTTGDLLSSPFGGVRGGFIIQPKYDGIAIELHYTSGNLTRALTRGNGYQGTDVTANIRTIKTIPLVLPEPETITVRGEALITAKEMKRLNKARRKQKQQLFNSPRNTVNALVKAPSTTETAAAGITFIAWSGSGGFRSAHSELQAINHLHSLGFITPPCKQANNPEEATQTAMFVAQQDHQLPTDGAVIKLNSRKQQQQAGHTKRNVKWAWALKPNNPFYTTTLRYISFKISIHGKITPVACFDPFTHNGATFRKAKINAKDISWHGNVPLLRGTRTPSNSGDGGGVTVTLTGGIIPQINLTETSGDNCPPAKGDETPSGVGGGTATATSSCPSCHQPLTFISKKKGYRCTNETWCPSRAHAAKTVMAHTGWETVVELPVTPGGKEAALAACLGKNAVTVRRVPNKHQYVIVADTLHTLAAVAVRLGEIDPVQHEFEQKSAEQITREAKQHRKKSSFLSKFTLLW